MTFEDLILRSLTTETPKTVFELRRELDAQSEDKFIQRTYELLSWLSNEGIVTANNRKLSEEERKRRTTPQPEFVLTRSGVIRKFNINPVVYSARRGQIH
jgi:hypothetical protein